MSAAPRVSQLVMYKHGVAFVARRGPVDGDFDLVFRRDEMKDVLKSLSVQLPDGQAAVRGIAFDTPSDPQAELAARNLLLGPGAAGRELLDGLRGRAIELHCADRTCRGEVIGVDESDGGARRLLVLRGGAGAVELVDLAEVRRVALLDDSSRTDLDYLIEKSRAATAGQSRTVRVQVRGAEPDARVSYLVPAAIWRVSYRLLRDGDRLDLVALGIVHNPLDEDLVDVELTLTTGEPVSFDIDLYHGKQVQRTVVSERARGLAQLRQAARSEVGAPSPMAVSAVVPGGAPGIDGDLFDEDDDGRTGSAYAEAADEVEAVERGEFFQYRLTTPVTLSRGGAAMVPLAAAPVDDVRRELIWSDGPDEAPQIVLSFTNSTGVVLEEGPAVVYEQGGYAGEAMLDFTARGAHARVAFARDLAVRCRHTGAGSTVTTGITLGADAVIQQQRVEHRHLLSAVNDHEEPVQVIFELPRTAGRTVAVEESTAAIADSADGRRHRVAVDVPGHGTAQVTVLESWPTRRSVAYRHLVAPQVAQWLAGGALDADTAGALEAVLAGWARAESLDEQRAVCEQDRDADGAAAGRIAEQLQVLGADGEEGRLRARCVAQLAALQERQARADAELRRLRTDADAARRAAAEQLRRLVGGAGVS